MTTPDPEIDGRDDEFRDAIRGLDLPSTPDTIERQTRRRLVRRSRQRRAGGVVALILVCGVLAWRPWNRPPAADPVMNQISSPLGLQNSDIEALFGLPPVEPLLLLDRSQDVAIHALRQWEDR